jgi:hypothetical protein
LSHVEGKSMQQMVELATHRQKCTHSVDSKCRIFSAGRLLALAHDATANKAAADVHAYLRLRRLSPIPVKARPSSARVAGSGTEVTHEVNIVEGAIYIDATGAGQLATVDLQNRRCHYCVTEHAHKANRP